MPQIWLIRHGETEWSVSGAHTGRTDIPLTPRGVEQAQATGRLIQGIQFARVFTSPLCRARDTARLVGWGEAAEVDDDLMEWDYGDYEGRSTAQIRETLPGWSVWRDAIHNGESLGQVRERALRVIGRVERHAAQSSGGHGRVALFGHGHMLRILAATWADLPPQAAQRLPMDTASISLLGEDRGTRVILGWNLAAEFIRKGALHC